MSELLLEVKDLGVVFKGERGESMAVEGASFDIWPGETVALVGESGSGKSVTALSLIDLVDSPGRVTSGEVWYRSPDLAEEFRDRGATVEGDHVDLRTVPKGVRRASTT